MTAQRGKDLLLKVDADGAGSSVEHLSAREAAAAGASGAGISFATAMIDPGALSPWLHVVTLGIGSLTGLASLVLVVLKIVQQRRAMSGR